MTHLAWLWHQSQKQHFRGTGAGPNKSQLGKYFVMSSAASAAENRKLATVAMATTNDTNGTISPPPLLSAADEESSGSVRSAAFPCRRQMWLQ